MSKQASAPLVGSELQPDLRFHACIAAYRRSTGSFDSRETSSQRGGNSGLIFGLMRFGDFFWLLICLEHLNLSQESDKRLLSKITEAGMNGPEILARTLSSTNIRDRYLNAWQYHSRSDHHSKVACWGVIFDLMVATPLLRRHVEAGAVCFGINHEMRDFVHDRKKNLDLVLCSPGGPATAETLDSMRRDYGIDLNSDEQAIFDKLPQLVRAPVGSVILALEAKACMTAHQRALPRLYDELNSSHQTVHGASDQAIAVGYTMVNLAEKYLSPDLNKKNRKTDPEWSKHNQPRDAQLAIDKIKQLPRRSKVNDVGYDALSIVVIDMANDGNSVTLVGGPPAPAKGDIYNYESMIARLSGIYATRFKDLS